MKNISVVFLSVFMALFLATSGQAQLSTTEIDRIRNKGVLDGEDFQVIDEFVKNGVAEITNTGDFTAISDIRKAIVSRSSSNRDSAQAQYQEQFFDSAYNYLSEAVSQAASTGSQQTMYKKLTNLLILIDNLNTSRLADLSLNYIDHPNLIVRYWAVRSVTSAAVLDELNTGNVGSMQLGRDICTELKTIVADASPETIEIMASFAGGIEVPQGRELLLAIADHRIKQYENWNVDRPLVEMAILQLLNSEWASAEQQEQKQQTGRRFGQLFSYVMQGYIKGQDYWQSHQKEQLVSVMVEIEKSVISRRLELAQSVIERSIEEDRVEALQREHDRLLGSPGQRGALAEAMNFNYAGESQAPKTLPAPPDRASQ
jgi:hypothetical protein